MSEDLFLKIFEKALTDDPNFPLSLEPRWVKKFSDADADFMANAQIDTLRFSSSKVAAKMQDDNRSILALTGFSIPDEDPDGLIEVESSPGNFSLFALVADIEVTGSAAEIRNVSEGISLAHPPYEGHDLDQIMALFPPMRFFELDGDYAFTSQLDRLVGSYCAKSMPGSGMKWNDDVCDAFSSLFETASDEIPFFILLRGILSESPQILFLDLYRCVEQLYSVPKVSALSKALELPGSIHDIARALEETISWRPKEDEAIRSLFSEVSEDLCAAIRACFGDMEAVDDPLKSADRAAKRVYKLRNASVHFRPGIQDEEISTENWNILIGSMVSIVSELYDRHGKTYHGVQV